MMIISIDDILCQPARAHVRCRRMREQVMVMMISVVYIAPCNALFAVLYDEENSNDMIFDILRDCAAFLSLFMMIHVMMI